MIRHTLLCDTALLALLLVSGSVFAQADKAKLPPLAAENSTSSKEPSFRASLLVIKSDWAISPNAKDISADLQKAWSNESERLKQLDKNAPAASWIFSTGAASVYPEEHYRQLLAWLEARQLVVSNEPFSMSSVGPAEKPFFTARLKKDGQFFGIQAARGKDEPFFTRKSEFTWSVMPSTIAQLPGLFIERELVEYEQGRGEAQPHPANPNEYDRCNFGIAPLEDDQVLMVHAFPAQQDGVFLEAARGKNLLALVVIEKAPQAAKANVNAEPKLLLPDKVLRIKVDRMRGIRSSGFFPSSSGQPTTPPPKGSQARMVIAKDVMISWSETKDVAWGFSKKLGQWAEQKLNPPASNTPPVVSENIAVWRIGSSYYGYSGDAGRWDVLRLPEGHEPPQVLDTDFARVHDGDDIYTFSAATGRWSSPKDAPSAAQNESAESPIKVYQLKNLKAAAAERIMRELLGDRVGSMAVDVRTNSLIITAPRGAPREESDKLFNTITALFVRLDEPGENATNSNSKTTKNAPAPIASLKSGYQEKEDVAASLAAKLRALQSADSPDKAQLEKLRPELRRAVADAFAARQALHEAEAAELQQRVVTIQQNLHARQRVEDQIIDHRIQDLLNPDLQWEAGPLAKKDIGSTTSSSTFNQNQPAENAPAR